MDFKWNLPTCWGKTSLRTFSHRLLVWSNLILCCLFSGPHHLRAASLYWLGDWHSKFYRPILYKEYCVSGPFLRTPLRGLISFGGLNSRKQVNYWALRQSPKLGTDAAQFSVVERFYSNRWANSYWNPLSPFPPISIMALKKFWKTSLMYNEILWIYSCNSRQCIIVIQVIHRWQQLFCFLNVCHWRKETASITDSVVVVILYTFKFLNP